MKPPQHQPLTFSKQVAAFQDQQRKLLENNQLMTILSQHHLENHHFYLPCQHKHSFQDHQQLITADTHTLQDHQPSTAAETQPSQDLHHSTTDLTNNTFQDHHHHHLDTTHTQPFQGQRQWTITVTTCSHTFQDHILQIYHTCTKDPSQDHTNRYLYYHYQHSQDHTNNTRTPYTTNMLSTSTNTTSTTTLHCMKKEDRNTGQYKDILW